MKSIFLFNFLLLTLTIANAQFFYGDNDECSSSAAVISDQPYGTDYPFSTTIGATFNANTDVFSCDSSSSKSTVFFTFTSRYQNVVFTLMSGYNINVTVLNHFEDDCNPTNLELTNNCFTDLDTGCNLHFQEPAQVLFTGLSPQTTYKLAVWTDEMEQTDFSFWLTYAQRYECGDGECYSLAENNENCPEDCDPISANILPPNNDDCLNARNYSLCIRPGLPACPIRATTIGATYNSGTDLFSCDSDTLKSTVFYQFATLTPNVEFNLLNGENINLTLLKYEEGNCSPGSFELTDNCITNLSARIDNEDVAEVLFTDLTPITVDTGAYVLAIWTDEEEETDFSFYLKSAPEIVCGDSICYDLMENFENCPQDCLNTSIKNYSDIFQIYPNPVIDNLYINTNVKTIIAAELKVHSMDGKIWHQESYDLTLINHKLNLTNLPEGMYYLKVVSGKKYYIHKFLKLD